MKKVKQVICFLSIAAFILSGCGGSRSGNQAAEAAVITGVALTAVAIQAARQKRKTPQAPTGKAGECCAVCGECEVPCGNSCIPHGVLCTRPKGCACTHDDNAPEGTPKPEPNPVSCSPSQNSMPQISM